PGSLTVVANWIPFEDPAGGPNFYKLDPAAHYYIKVDNTGDGKEDVSYEFKFHQRFRHPGSFLYAAPTVDSIGDPDLNFVQTYTVTRETFRKGHETGSKVIARNVPVAPDNVGPKTMPDYARVSAGATRHLRAGGKAFVGP